MKTVHTDLLMNTSAPIIKLDKPLITFKINKNYINLLPEKKINKNNDLIPLSECNINVTNVTTNYVAVRVRTTKKNNYHYTVKPTFYTLSPNSTIKIIITIHLRQNEKLSSKGHKFRFEGVIIPDNLLNKETREIFTELTKNKIEVKGNSLKRIVEFIDDDNPDYQKLKTVVHKDYEESGNDILTQHIDSGADSKSNEKQPINYFQSVNKDIIKQNDINVNNLKNNFEELKNENNELTKKLNEIKKKANNVINEKKYQDLIPQINNSKIIVRYIFIFLILAILIGFFLTK